MCIKNTILIVSVKKLLDEERGEVWYNICKLGFPASQGQKGLHYIPGSARAGGRTLHKMLSEEGGGSVLVKFVIMIG